MSTNIPGPPRTGPFIGRQALQIHSRRINDAVDLSFNIGDRRRVR